ncbi:hypothetical protein GCM10010519_69070 [Streptomyces lactacystinicus]
MSGDAACATPPGSATSAATTAAAETVAGVRRRTRAALWVIRGFKVLRMRLPPDHRPGSWPGGVTTDKKGRALRF